MAKARIDLNNASIGRILKGEGRVRADLQSRGSRVAKAAGPGHEVQTYVGQRRLRVTVRTIRPVPANQRAVLRRALEAGR